MSTKAATKQTEFLTPTFRLSYPKLFKPDAMGESKPSYSIEMLFDKKTTKLIDLQRPLFEAATAKWGADKTKWPKGLQLAVKDGDKPRDNEDAPAESRRGMWVVKASRLAEFGKPHVVDRERNPILNEADIYPGCYARATLSASTWEYMKKYGVRFNLLGVQFVKNGVALGGLKPADQMFGVIEEEDDFETTTATEEIDAEENQDFM